MGIIIDKFRQMTAPLKAPKCQCGCTNPQCCCGPIKPQALDTFQNMSTQEAKSKGKHAIATGVVSGLVAGGAAYLLTRVVDKLAKPISVATGVCVAGFAMNLVLRKQAEKENLTNIK